jgi:Asp-tRNA(Asn)/Glu-tRNA(Gln) amidotransferase A subunit family amidase
MQTTGTFAPFFRAAHYVGYRINSADFFVRFVLTAGSYSLFGSTVSSDETVAKKLRDHGTIILGKMSMTEWMNFRSSNSSNGWTARGGQTSGAYYPLQDPNGSSSGSAVAVDLGLAVAALGTEVNAGALCCL